jgi:hypothetical protein
MKGGLNIKNRINPASQVNWFMTFGLISGAFSAALFFSGILYANSLPAECPGTLADYNIILGSSKDETIRGTPGDDYIYGNGGSDNIYGNGGNDCIVADGGNDNITTGAGNDVILVGGENNIIKAGDGNNKVFSGDGRDNITTGSGNDYIDAGDGNNAVRSGAGDDTIITGNGNDYVNGGDGIDSCNAGGGSNIVVNCETESDAPPTDPGNGGENNNPPPVGPGSDTGGGSNPPSDNSGAGDNNNGSNGGGSPENSGDQTDNSSGTENGDSGTGSGGIALSSGGGGGVPPVEIMESKIENPALGLVIISWQTNIPATSQIVYGESSIANLGPAPSYGYEFVTPKNKAFTTDHRVEIYNLETGRGYYFRPVSDVINAPVGIGKELTIIIATNEAVILASAPSNIFPVVIESLPNPTDALVNSGNSGVIVRNFENASVNETLALRTNVADSELALLFGVLPITAGQFGFLLILILLIAFIVWQVARREREKVNKTV